LTKQRASFNNDLNTFIVDQPVNGDQQKGAKTK